MINMKNGIKIKDGIKINDGIKVKNGMKIRNAVMSFWNSEEGMGVVEVVLITIVLVGLVVVFKKQITDLVNSILSKMTNQANKI